MGASESDRAQPKVATEQEGVKFHEAVGKGNAELRIGEAHTPLSTIPLSAENRQDAKSLADYFGQQAQLGAPDTQKLQGFIEAGMKGDFSQLARLADPKNAKAADAFAGMMKQLGYGVSIDHPATSHSGKPFDSVNIVEDKQAGTVGGIGLQMTHRETNGKHFFGYEGTRNLDRSIEFFKDQATLTRLQKALSTRLHNSVDKD